MLCLFCIKATFLPVCPYTVRSAHAAHWTKFSKAESHWTPAHAQDVIPAQRSRPRSWLPGKLGDAASLELRKGLLRFKGTSHVYKILTKSTLCVPPLKLVSVCYRGLSSPTAITLSNKSFPHAKKNKLLQKQTGVNETWHINLFLSHNMVPLKLSSRHL